MNRHDVQILRQTAGYPSLTITMPTNRSSPENRQDPIRIKNLVEQAENRLLKEFSKRDLAPLLDRLRHLAGSIEYRNTLDGLALFVNQDISRAIYLPFPLQERVVVGETFFTRDLMFALNRTPRYWALILSEKPTRLYIGIRGDLIEIIDGGFPVTHEGPGGTQPLPGGFGIKRSAYRDENHRKFFRQVDTALKPFLADDPLPLVVTGVDRFLAFFNEVTNHKEALLASLTGSYDKTSPHEMAKLVWPLVDRHLASRRRQIFSDLELAMGERKCVSGPGEAWKMAMEGRGRILLVEEDFHYPARVDSSGMVLLPAKDPDAPDVMDDAVDELIEAVVSKQGGVVFVENGQLEAHQRIALILRY